jgi:multicomponent Na+:H+ antiporter subunit F
MVELALAAALVVLATVVLGLFRVLRGARAADGIMAVQLFGTGGVAVLLLLSAVIGDPAIVDVALSLALLSAFASIAFVKSFTIASSAESPEERDT